MVTEMIFIWNLNLILSYFFELLLILSAQIYVVINYIFNFEIRKCNK